MSPLLTRPPLNTYESSSCQGVDESRAAARCGREGISDKRPVSASHSVFASLRGAGPGLCTQHVSRLTPARVWRDERGDVRSPRPRSSSVPSCRPPHDVDLVLAADPLSPGSEKGQSRRKSSARRSRCRERERENGSNQSVRLPDLRAPDRCLLALGDARGRRDLVRARSLRLSLDDGLSHPSLPQCIVAMNRSPSNAFSRKST